jgi:hypothetical protein
MRHQWDNFKIRIVLFSKHRDEVNNIFLLLAQTITDIESVLAVVFCGFGESKFSENT